MLSNVLSFESAKWKTMGTIRYCDGPHFFYDNFNDFVESLPSLQENSMVGVYNYHTPQQIVGCGKLIEAVTYVDGSIHLLMLNQPNEQINLALPTTPPNEVVKSYSLSFICTADEPYLSLLRDTLKFYRAQSDDDLANVEISVVMFGKAELPEWVRVMEEPRENFDMSYARNKCLTNTKHDHVFMLDADVRILKDQLAHIIDIYHTVPNHGVLNLKNNHEMGNGLYFGNKTILQRNGYDERFKKFWFEDTEYLMNFSRIGIVPLVVFEPFLRVNHSRNKTTPSELTNLELMTNIVNKGSRNL